MRREARQRGQNLAELALVAPLLIALFIGVADLGRAFHAFIVMENAAREAARYGASFPDRLTQNTAPSAKLRAADEVQSLLGVELGDIHYGAVPEDPGAGQVFIDVQRVGDAIQVEVGYGFTLIAGGFIGVDAVTLVGTANMMVLSGGG